MANNPDRASYFPAIEKKYGLPMSYWFEQMESVKDLKYPEQMEFLRAGHGFTRDHANALVLYSRGSKSAHRYSTVDGYLAQFDAQKVSTMHAILRAAVSKSRALELVIAWNHPMIKHDQAYVFGASVHTHHLLLSPLSESVLDQFRTRLTGYVVNKKTFQVPVDWKVDAKLVKDMVGARMKEVQE